MVTLFYKMIDFSVCLYMLYIFFFLNILIYHFVLWNSGEMHYQASKRMGKHHKSIIKSHQYY